MAKYIMDMQTDKKEEFYFIREKESHDIVYLPSKYLMHKKLVKVITEYHTKECLHIILLFKLYG